ncbi:PhzF family phenazine biosynthesis protein [Aminobacterium sp. UBA5514]|uniref:PhzF family phenazine biosynthesis protein n=1 Tax=Aminobacterium sp. UBA5514 TaxID=1946036 RepID=UPI00257E78E4|nr:PhzF family phenazine biosynthesis protein [Aminobacterium sp. UBA5514]
MKKHEFYIVDVFGEKKYAGNPLAVVRDAGDLSTEDMLEIAREMNYSETSFILHDKPLNGGYPVRIFTPAGEVPFAGHPTLGTAAVIIRELAPGNPNSIALSLKAGLIQVRREEHLFIMEQNTPEFGPIYPPEDLVSVLGVTSDAIMEEYPVQWVSTGLPTIIVPFRRRDVLSRVRLDRDAYDAFIQRTGKVLILAFCPEPVHSSNHLHVRVLAPCFGVEEDPATGSGAGCLASYLVRHRFLGSSSIENVRVEQGYAVHRPSLLFISAKDSGGQIRVWVGGNVIPVAKGELI